MICNPDQVIVNCEQETRVPLHSLCVHHREFPEVRAEGRTPEAAARRLAELLAMTLDSAPSDWRREIVQHAIDDVLAFAEKETR
jgi:hypothetical protein